MMEEWRETNGEEEKVKEITKNFGMGLGRRHSPKGKEKRPESEMAN
jgi:hypothetical protein